MSYCNNCGREVNDESFCAYCGHEIKTQSQKPKKTKSKKSPIKIIVILLCCVTLVTSGIIGAIKIFGNDKNEDTYGFYNSFAEGFTDVKITNETTAIEAVASVADMLGVKDTENELEVSRVDSLDGDKFYRISQKFKDFPVYGRSIVVSADENGNATALTSNYVPVDENINLEPSASYDGICEAIETKLNIDRYYIDGIERKNLVIYISDNGNSVLAYNLTVNEIGTVIVNAQNAEILLYKENINDFSSEVRSKDGSVSCTGWGNDDGSHHLYNEEYNISVFDVNGIKTSDKNSSSVYTDFRNYNVETMYSKNNVFDKKGVTLLKEIINISDFYKAFGFQKFDRLHAAINDSYDYGKNARGGFSNQNGQRNAIMLVGKKFNFNNIEVIAHEYNHAVSADLVNWNGSSVENKALNEAYSDIFGVIFENKDNPDWIINHMSKILRNLTDPSKTNGYSNMGDMKNPNDYDKYTISTIISHSAYSMWNGIDGSDSKKIDAKTLSKIWYKSMLLMQSDADFSQCRNAVELSARIMLKNNAITNEQYQTVVTAFDNAGIKNDAYTYSKVVKNDFDLSVLSSKGTENIGCKLEIVKLPNVFAGPEYSNAKVETVMEKTMINGRQGLNLDDGYYVLTITDANDKENISKPINVKIVVNGKNEKAVDEVVIRTDFSDVITAIIDNQDNTQENKIEYVNGTYLVVVDGKIIGARDDGVYYKENINAEMKKIAYDSYVSSLMSDGNTVYYVEGFDEFTPNISDYEKYKSKKIYKTKVTGGKKKQVAESDGLASLLTCKGDSIYYIDIVKVGDSKYQYALVKYDMNLDKTTTVDTFMDSVPLYWVPSAYVVGKTIFYAKDNLLYGYDISTEKVEKVLDYEGVFCKAIEGKVCFKYSKGNSYYIAMVDADRNVETSAAIDNKYTLQAITNNGKYALTFDIGFSDFNLYTFDLKTGEKFVQKDGAVSCIGKAYSLHKDLMNPNKLYLQTSWLFDEETKTVVKKKTDQTPVDIHRPDWIVDDYVVDWDLNLYKIYDEDWTPSTEVPTEKPTEAKKISQEEAQKLAYEKAGGDGYRAVYYKTVQYNGEDYYLFNISHEVDDNEDRFHYSHIGYIIVSMDGKEVNVCDYVNDQVQVF